MVPQFEILTIPLLLLDSHWCKRNCCGPSYLRCFDVSIEDLDYRHVIHMSRPWRCGPCWLPCCLQEIEISTPSGQLLGQVKQKWSFFGYPKYKVLDETGTEVYRVCGPWWTCCGTADYVIKSPDESQELGCIKKVWAGVFKEHFTDADDFEIDFPPECSLNMKAILIGALILIDFMHYERHPPQERRRSHH